MPLAQALLDWSIAGDVLEHATAALVEQLRPARPGSVQDSAYRQILWTAGTMRGTGSGIP